MKEKGFHFSWNVLVKGKVENTNTTAFLLVGYHSHWRLLKMVGLPTLDGNQVWLFVFEMARRQCLLVQTARQWECQSQRKTQLSIANTDHTIKLYQSGKHLILCNWTFPENSPWINLSHSSASSWPISFCHPASYNTSVVDTSCWPTSSWSTLEVTCSITGSSHAHRYFTIKDLFLPEGFFWLHKYALESPGMQGRTKVPGS